MGGEGYSVIADWKTLFNEERSAAQFALMNALVAVKINTYVTGNPSTDVASTHTNTAKMISDELIMILSNYIKESSMTDPPEFVHYKIPHFTPLHYTMMTIMKKTVRVGRIIL